MDETASASAPCLWWEKNEQCDEALGVQFLIILIYINTCTINNSIGTCVQVQYSGCLDLPIVARFIIRVFYILIQRQASRGGNFHYKGIYRCAAGMGYTFQASQYMNGYHFYIKSISMGYLFHPKSIWMGKFWKIVYEWGQFSKIVYEWGQFSMWEVYEWVMFFTWPGIWMGWGSGTPAAHPYPKSWQVTPPPVAGF